MSAWLFAHAIECIAVIDVVLISIVIWTSAFRK